MKILVTGAAGFIGSHLCERLLLEGNDVHGLDNFEDYYNPAIKELNAGLLNKHPGFTLYRADIRDAEILNTIFEANKIELVVHLAAKAGVRPSIIEPALYMDVNCTGLTNVLEASAKHGVRRFIFASSSSVYGNQKKTPFSETDDIGFPISPYAASKRSGELICHAYHHLYGMQIACLRLFTVYGPRQRPDLAIHKFTQLALQNKPIELFGTGDTVRDYTFISDIVEGIITSGFHPKLGYEIFNLGNGNPVGLIEMIDALQKELNMQITIHKINKQAGDVDQTHADISKANAYFGFQPKVKLAEGVRLFLNWYRNTHR